MTVYTPASAGWSFALASNNLTIERDTLAAALQSKDSANDVIEMIEARFAAAPACGHCRSARIGAWGHVSGLKRYLESSGSQ